MICTSGDGTQRQLDKVIELTILLNVRYDVYSEGWAPASPCLRPLDGTSGSNRVGCKMKMVDEWRETFGGREGEEWEDASAITLNTHRSSPLGGAETLRESSRTVIGDIKRAYPPNPVSEYKTHGYTAVLEQPRLFRNAELSDELFTRNSLGYIRDKVKLGVYCMR